MGLKYKKGDRVKVIKNLERDDLIGKEGIIISCGYDYDYIVEFDEIINEGNNVKYKNKCCDWFKEDELELVEDCSSKTEAQKRKDTPIFSGFVKYFPLAIAEIARVSKKGNDQHNSGQPLHWERSKSTDEPDALMRHLTDYAKGNNYDTDGTLHLSKVAWRAMALLEKYLEEKDIINLNKTYTAKSPILSEVTGTK